MKVLLLGEYSGLHDSLKGGLKSLGVDADIASDGDSWKKFSSDYSFSSPFSSHSLAGRVFKNIKPFGLISDLKNYELVQFINPMILTPRFGLNARFVDLVLDKARKTILLAAGDDSYYYGAIHRLRYNPIDDFRAIDLRGARTAWDHEGLVKTNQILAARASKIIPVAYDYWLGYSHLNNCAPVIPMPINVEKYAYKRNDVGSKIIFHHGINRPGFKGSKFIIEAFDQLRDKYRHEAEFVVTERLPIQEYLWHLDRSNVILDQALSYSYGMNALISMAMGKVVMSGAEPEILEHYGAGSCPVINLLPDPEQIKRQIENLIEQRDQIGSMGEQSRDYVEKVHSHRVVAGRFLEAWATPAPALQREA